AVTLARALRVTRVGIASLDHESRDHAVEGRAVVEALAREIQEVLDVARCLVIQELDFDLAEARLDDHVGRGWLRHWFPPLELKRSITAILRLLRASRRRNRDVLESTVELVLEAAVAGTQEQAPCLVAAAQGGQAVGTVETCFGWQQPAVGALLEPLEEQQGFGRSALPVVGHRLHELG